ncbi:MAG: 7-cyano-7-deazaguanine synthase, partial [Pseudomonadota bacterium]|nr:7-cyano-7-deazaguanine synthase [Pseudomonadota bacterium]
MADKQLGLILLSGGLDSTTAAAWVIDHGMTVSAVSFDYGQTH